MSDNVIKLHGCSLIGAGIASRHEHSARAVQAATQLALEPAFYQALDTEIEQAAQLARDAFAAYRSTTARQRAAFLRDIASELELLGDGLVERAGLETALPEARLRGELARTCGQLRMFALMLDEGRWLDARIEHALPDRAPLPKPDLRSMLRAVGPVAVFCASNFPFAYSVAGGDTASALAVGCPVIVKAHEAHPGTAEGVGRAIQSVVQRHGLPEGVFSLLHGHHEVGQALVRHPVIQAVGFTGSRRGGLALQQLAAARKQPIPVYAEMSAINPVILLPESVKERGESLSQQWLASLTLGVGQFCTNPGLLLLPVDHAQAFLEPLAHALPSVPHGVMLHAGIAAAYQTGVSRWEQQSGVKRLVAATTEADNCVAPAVFVVSGADFMRHPALQAEVFGPAGLIVCYELGELAQIIDSLEGQLTATIHGTSLDFDAFPWLLDALEPLAGRLIINGFPTGVEVCSSMVHGGPFPATSDGRSSSVGPMAALRFCRPVCWQSCPDVLLPQELQEGNPLGIPRLVDGRYVDSAISATAHS